MKSGFSKIVPAVCFGFFLAAQGFAADTNSVATNTDAVVNGYLQIQMQLHDAQLELEKNREEARQTAADTAARLQSLEDSLASQRAKELETAQKNQQSMFMMAGAFGLTVLAAVLFMVYLQWRAVTRLVEMPGRSAAGLLPVGSQGAHPLLTSSAVAEANTRLFGVVDQLQKRILELEQGSRAALAEGDSHDADGLKPESARDVEVKANRHTDRIAELISNGETFLKSNHPEKALPLFDEALAVDPKHTDALLKKAGALERLERINEAAACYDRVIESGGPATMAYFQKGGMFNRLARYEEALKCYEQALQAKEKKSVAVVN
ncbi:MAG TPA: tetratricopeptide repeat protein [Verrucomicrobiae bacterium]|nr:tetratricopeptide repeat protein [Verrucomicrobiae bacterium]